jgi:hypothetical protein
MTQSEQSKSSKKKKKHFEKKLSKDIQRWEEWEKLSDEEKNERRKIAEIRDENKYAWWKVNPATKALIVVNGILTFVLILITAITVIQQNKTNSLTEDNLNIIQRDFELNSRPYVSVESTNYSIHNDTLDLTFVVKNYGKLPGKISLTKTPTFGKPYELNFSPNQEKSTIYPNHSLDFHQLFTEYDPSILKKLQIKIIYTPLYSSDKKYESNMIYQIDHNSKICKLIYSEGN